MLVYPWYNNTVRDRNRPFFYDNPLASWQIMATMAEALEDIEDEFEDVDESFCVLDDDPGSGIRVSVRRVITPALGSG